MTDFTIKDSGTRTEFAGGMVRDADAGDKTDYTSVMFGPMLERWAVHCTKGRVKYPDAEPGIPNWTLAASIEEWLHARGSLLRHLMAFLRGEQDEDHAAAIMFNVNVMEYTRERIGYAPDVFITAPVSEDNAGPEPSLDDQVNEATEQALPLDLSALNDVLAFTGLPSEYRAEEIPEKAVVSGRLVRRGLKAVENIEDMTQDGPWCDSRSPDDPASDHGGSWCCERPPDHAGDHAWDPIACGWDEPAAEQYITRWGQSPLYRIDTPEEALPDE